VLLKRPCRRWRNGAREDFSLVRTKSSLRFLLGALMIPWTSHVLVLSAALFLVLSVPGSSKEKFGIEKRPFGKTSGGEAVDLYVLTNRTGMQVSITNYGATIVSVRVPDRTGKVEDVVLGFDTVGEYETGKAYFGATIGRYANRIAGGRFQLVGKTYDLPKNDGPNTLHGGINGFNKRVWAAMQSSADDHLTVELSYVSRDGEEGFPGNLSAQVIFEMPSDRNELLIRYRAETDKATVVNLTNHSYFNLAGEGNGSILSHKLTIYGGKYTPVDKFLIPTGELRDAHNTPFDFEHEIEIGARINDSDEQLKFGLGYDHNWVLEKKPRADSAELAARLTEPTSGRTLDVLTTEPGLQFYSGNFLDGKMRGKGNKPYEHRSALCLETQHFPDSPNHSTFPSTILQPGKPYRSTTIFRFFAK
jgi:aldose 1-epimerase